MSGRWTGEELGALARAFQGSCVLAAGAELDVFTPLSRAPRTAASLAAALSCDPRGMRVLLDALSAIGLLRKSGARYLCAAGVGKALRRDAPSSLLPGLRHLANCLRRWAELARAVRSGNPAPERPSILGKAGDQASFIAAMHGFSAPMAERVVAAAKPPRFRRLLDVGGGSGTWTMALLRREPKARAVIFDLPRVIAMARERLAGSSLSGRVEFRGGDYLKDALPKGADLAWLSAVIHQNSRPQNRELFSNIRRSLEPGGCLLIRDVVMEEGRAAPAAGALFAINMLVGTAGGGTFTLRELRQDLEASGFTDARLVHRDPGMNSIVRARRP